MGKKHQLAERRQAILAALKEQGGLSVADLSQQFNVSEVTIRTDLRALSSRSQLIRPRGRALALGVSHELTFDVRQQLQAEKKDRIGRAAARLVSSGDTIALDASTTALAMLPYLKQLPQLTLVTNSLKVALGLLDAPHIHLIMPGGYLRRESISLVGLSSSLLEDLHVQTGFFGAWGLTVQDGLTDVSLDEVSFKRLLVARCRRVVGVVDARKWGQVAAATFARLEQVQCIISDDAAPSTLVDEVRACGVEVILA